MGRMQRNIFSFDEKSNFYFSIFRVLFPGGATWFNATSGYGDAGRIILKLAKQKNDNEQYFPLFGTCLGFELLMYLTAGHRGIFVTCNSQRQALPLEFTPGSVVVV